MIQQWLNKKLKQIEKRQQSYYLLLDHMELICDRLLPIYPKVYLKMQKVIFYLKYGRYLKGIRRKLCWKYKTLKRNMDCIDKKNGIKSKILYKNTRIVFVDIIIVSHF